MADPELRGGNRSCDRDHPHISVAEAGEDADRVSDRYAPPTTNRHRPIRRLPATRNSPYFVLGYYCSHLSLQAPTISLSRACIFSPADIYWKKEHRLICTSDVCTAAERDRYEKAIFKSQRNVILCVSAILLYWCIYQICKFYKEMQKLEEEEQRRKDL